MSEEKNIPTSPLDVSVAKIVASPTPKSWSQAYNAGSLFAVLSLGRKQAEEEEEQEENSLASLGKEVFNSLEAEYFSLETKNLSSIKEAVITASKILLENLSSCLVVATLPPGTNILYVFALGGGKAVIKRGDRLGTILIYSETEQKITSASGRLTDGDIIILQTTQFANIISEETIASSLDNYPPAEIAEILSPKIHETEEGGATAIIFSYSAPAAPAASQILEKQEIIEEKEEPASPAFFATAVDKFKKLKFNPGSIVGGLNHSRKVFLSLAFIIVVILLLSILFAVRKQQNDKTQALFAQIQNSAQKKHDEGQALVGLNKNLARDDFEAAKKILEDGKTKFGANSKEEKQILELLAKVQTEIDKNSPSKGTVNLDRSKIILAVKNGSGTEGVAGKASDFLKGLGYKVSATENADNYNYKGATIRVKNSISNYLDLLKKDLSEKYTVTAATSDLSSDSPTDAFVIIGK